MSNFTVVSFTEQFTPHTVERKDDKQQFSIGDFVTNGTAMKGVITRFELSQDKEDVFVYTDWSGVGMNLDSLSKELTLPSAYQINQVVRMRVCVTTAKGQLEQHAEQTGTVRAIHFYKAKDRVEEKYDLDLWYQNDEHFRVYNVPVKLLQPA